MKSGKLPYRPKAANPEVGYRQPTDDLRARPPSKAAKALSYSASELLKGWRKVWPAALCRGSQACSKVGEKRAMFPSGIAFTFLHIARKPLIVKEFCPDYRDSRFLHAEKRESAAICRVRADKTVKCCDRVAIMAG